MLEQTINTTKSNFKQLSPEQIQDFWQQYDRFLASPLTTESPHPKSYNLSDLCQNDLVQAFEIFRDIEIDALDALNNYQSQILNLKHDIATVRRNNGRIFLIGCGASGRLAAISRRLNQEYNQNDDVVHIAAGGDISLIKSVEQFEDRKEFGIKQLLIQGYTANDLLIGLSASGESPFILAALQYALNNSIYSPYLVCNNNKEILLLRDPNHVVRNLKVNTLALDVGPMALTGSTRLQATTAMQFALGYALCDIKEDFATLINRYKNTLTNINLKDFSKITFEEANTIEQKGFVNYVTNDPFLGLSLLADITERSPTFNLVPFEKQNEYNSLELSLFYMSLNSAENSEDAWLQLLKKHPVCLNWKEFPVTTSDYIQGFDLSIKSNRAEGKYLPAKQRQQQWNIMDNVLKLEFIGQQFNLVMPDELFLQSLLSKFLLNSHSTLMLGRLGYFSANLMLGLKPSNNKLMDRAIRYSIFLLKHKHGLDIDYKIVAETLFLQIPLLKTGESIVLKVIIAILTDQ